MHQKPWYYPALMEYFDFITGYNYCIQMHTDICLLTFPKKEIKSHNDKIKMLHFTVKQSQGYHMHHLQQSMIYLNATHNSPSWVTNGVSIWSMLVKLHLDGLVQERCNSSALAMELCVSCTNASALPQWDFFVQQSVLLHESINLLFIMQHNFVYSIQPIPFH